MKKIKYTPDAADKLRALKIAISQEHGSDIAKKIVKSITDAIRGLCDNEEKDPEVSKMFDVGQIIGTYLCLKIMCFIELKRNIFE